jgi:hypothetical protein
MKFAVWLRAIIDALMRTPYLRSLEAQQTQLRTDLQHRLADRDRLIAAKELQLLQERQDLTERLRDKDAVITDLKLRLAVIETDVVREKLAKQERKPKPVPDFGGPLAWQDELAQMDLKVDETQEKTDEI